MASQPSSSDVIQSEDPLYQLCIFNDEDQWCLNYTKTEYSNQKSSKFLTFDHLQNKLFGMMESYPSVRDMIISQTNTVKQLRLSKNAQPAKVRSLTFRKGTVGYAEIIEQVDTDHFRKLQLEVDNPDPELFKMEQVLKADWSILGENNFSQPVYFQGQELIIKNNNGIAQRNINFLIKRSIVDMDPRRRVTFNVHYHDDNPVDRAVMFDYLERQRPMHLGEGEALIGAHPRIAHLKLRLKYGRGYAIGRSVYVKEQRQFYKWMPRDDTPLMTRTRIVKLLKIEYFDGNYDFTIGEEEYGQTHFEYDTQDELQLVFTEKVDRIIYIEELIIVDTSRNWFLQYPEGAQIRVGKLTLSDGNNAADYLNQIEPIHLKNITINGSDKNEAIYNMPQVIHAKKLIVAQCRIRDEQLMELEASWLELTTENASNLTVSGINAFIKKRLPELNVHDFHFDFYMKSNKDSSKIIDGFDISSFKKISEFESETVVESPYPKYQLELKKLADSYIIKRVEKEDD